MALNLENYLSPRTLVALEKSTVKERIQLELLINNFLELSPNEQEVANRMMCNAISIKQIS